MPGLIAGGPFWVTNGCADNMSGTSEVPQVADPLCATRKSAEVGHKPSFMPLRQPEHRVTVRGDAVLFAH
jgi:hypothetical protein